MWTYLHAQRFLPHLDKRVAAPFAVGMDREKTEALLLPTCAWSHQLSVGGIFVEVLHRHDRGNSWSHHVQSEEAVDRAYRTKLHVLLLVRFHVGGILQRVEPKVAHNFPMREHEALLGQRLDVTSGVLLRLVMTESARGGASMGQFRWFHDCE